MRVQVQGQPLLDQSSSSEASDRLRVLRPLPSLQALDGFEGLTQGLFVDVETTGSNPSKDEIVQLAAIEFGYSGTELVGIGGSLCGLRQPSICIPEKMTRLTGIDDSLVCGRSIDLDELKRMIIGVEVVASHNAAFDRPFLERLCPAFRRVRWACSMTQVPWEDEGYEAVKLSHLVSQAGYFYGANDAEANCRAALAMLALPLPFSRETGFSKMISGALAKGARVWAVGAPFATRQALKSRGYRWSPGGRGRPKAWYLDLRVEDAASEVAYLSDQVCFSQAPFVTEITAFDRFSDRC